MWFAAFSTILAVKFADGDNASLQGLPSLMITGFLFEACVEATALYAIPFFSVRLFSGNTVFVHRSEYLWMIIGLSVLASLTPFSPPCLIYSAGALAAAWICRGDSWTWLYLLLGGLRWMPRLPLLAIGTSLNYVSCTAIACVAQLALTAIVLAHYTVRYSVTRCGFVGFATQIGVATADTVLLFSLLCQP